LREINAKIKLEVGKEIAVDELLKQHFAILKKLSKLDKNLIFIYVLAPFHFLNWFYYVFLHH